MKLRVLLFGMTFNGGLQLGSTSNHFLGGIAYVVTPQGVEHTQENHDY